LHKPMPRTIAAVRNTFATYLDNAGSVVVQQKTTTPDGAGGETPGVTVVGTVDAWLQPMSVVSQIEAAGGATGEKQMYTLVCGTTVPLALGYQVVYSGGTYEVTNLSHTTVIEWASFQKATIARVAP
jgi:hypothetical protein